MSKIRITKEFSFEMAHALFNYDGKCRNIHGHSYKLFVTIIGEPISDIDNPKNGMLVDFGELKQIVNKEIVDKYDHSFVLYDKDSRRNSFVEMLDNLILIPYQPTCENMVSDFAKRIDKHLPEHLQVYCIRLYETASSFAEWCLVDNHE